MEPEGSLPHSQVPAICPYPEPARSSPTPTSHFLKIHLNIILPYTPGSSKWHVSLRFPYQKPVYTSAVPHYVLHAPPISFLSILTPDQFLVNSPGHSAVQIIQQYKSFTSTDQSGVQIIQQYRPFSSTNQSAILIIQQCRSVSSTDHSAVQNIQQYRSFSDSLCIFLWS